MRSYEIITPLRRNGKKTMSGTVELDPKEGEPLVAIGALRPATAKAATSPPPPPPPPATAKPLAEQSFQELKATAKSEKVPRYGLIRGGPEKLREAIEAHRAAKAG